MNQKYNRIKTTQKVRNLSERQNLTITWGIIDESTSAQSPFLLIFGVIEKKTSYTFKNKTVTNNVRKKKKQHIRMSLTIFYEKIPMALYWLYIHISKM